jgi:hypothetical protein
MDLSDYIRIGNIHEATLEFNLREIKNFKLSSTSNFKNLTIPEKNPIDVVIMRFGQLQDMIGAQIFPRILEYLEESNPTDSFIDKLHKLEKLEYLPDVQWWRNLRKLRNNFSHDYLDDYEAIALFFNDLMTQVPQLLDYWKKLQEKLEILINTTSK